MNGWFALAGAILWTGAMADGSIEYTRWRSREPVQRVVEVGAGPKAVLYGNGGAPALRMFWVAVVQGCVGIGLMASGISATPDRQGGVVWAVLCLLAAAIVTMQGRRAGLPWITWSRRHLLVAGYAASAACFALAALTAPAAVAA